MIWRWIGDKSFESMMTQFADKRMPCRAITDHEFTVICETHNDVIKWTHFPRYWPFVRGIHRSPVNSPHKGQWRGALLLYWTCAWINSWVSNREASDLRRPRAHYHIIVMFQSSLFVSRLSCILQLDGLPDNWIYGCHLQSYPCLWGRSELLSIDP